MKDTKDLVGELIESCHGTLGESVLMVAIRHYNNQDLKAAVNHIYNAMVEGKIGISETIWEKFRDCVWTMPGQDNGRVMGLLQDNLLIENRT